MRSRYTAYAIGHTAHLMRTTHPDSPHRRSDRVAWRDELVRYCEAARFTGLEVVDAPPPHRGEGYVEFRATFELGGQPRLQAERSRFLRHEGRWAYVDGAPPHAGDDSS